MFRLLEQSWIAHVNNSEYLLEQNYYFAVTVKDKFHPIDVLAMLNRQDNKFAENNNF